MDEFFGADVREPLEFHVGQLLGEDRGRRAQLGDVHLKNTVDSSIPLQVSKRSRPPMKSRKWRATTFQWSGSMKASDEREEGVARFAGWNSRWKTKSGNGRKPHTRPFPLSFPIFPLPPAARPNSTPEFLSSWRTRSPSGFRPTDVATLSATPSPSPR